MRRAFMADRIFDGAVIDSHAAVLVEDGRVVGVAPRPAIPADAASVTLPEGALLAPGFVDVQVNGGGGVLFNDAPTVAALETIARAHRRFGTTSLLPTLITDSPATMRAAVDAVDAAIRAGVAGIAGIHLEGPFISRARKGVHPADRIAAFDLGDAEAVPRVAPPGVSLITVAPECLPPGAIRRLVERGFTVAAGHSEATAAQVAAAIGEGLTGFTHLFNAMSPLGSREPGMVGAALASAATYAGIIVDGHHVAPATLGIAIAAKGTERLMLVTDAMPTIGTEARSFTLFGETVSVADGRCVTASGTLAGAHLDMASAVRNAQRLLGLDLAAALAMATRIPATFLGLERRIGRIAAGNRADFVALDAELAVIGTWIGGERA
jgi:N-acetylglucosamine-6-phosphate deacetylase